MFAFIYTILTQAVLFAAEAGGDGLGLDATDLIQFGVLGVFFALAMAGKLRFEREVSEKDRRVEELKAEVEKLKETNEAYQEKFEYEIFPVFLEALKLVPPLVERNPALGDRKRGLK